MERCAVFQFQNPHGRVLVAVVTSERRLPAAVASVRFNFALVFGAKSPLSSAASGPFPPLKGSWGSTICAIRMSLSMSTHFDDLGGTFTIA